MKTLIFSLPVNIITMVCLAKKKKKSPHNLQTFLLNK